MHGIGGHKPGDIAGRAPAGVQGAGLETGLCRRAGIDTEPRAEGEALLRRDRTVAVLVAEAQLPAVAAVVGQYLVQRLAVVVVGRRRLAAGDVPRPPLLRGTVQRQQVGIRIGRHQLGLTPGKSRLGGVGTAPGRREGYGKIVDHRGGIDLLEYRFRAPLELDFIEVHIGRVSRGAQRHRHPIAEQPGAVECQVDGSVKLRAACQDDPHRLPGQAEGIEQESIARSPALIFLMHRRQFGEKFLTDIDRDRGRFRLGDGFDQRRTLIGKVAGFARFEKPVGVVVDRRIHPVEAGGNAGNGHTVSAGFGNQPADGKMESRALLAFEEHVQAASRRGAGKGMDNHGMDAGRTGCGFSRNHGLFAGQDAGTEVVAPADRKVAGSAVAQLILDEQTAFPAGRQDDGAPVRRIGFQDIGACAPEQLDGIERQQRAVTGEIPQQQGGTVTWYDLQLRGRLQCRIGRFGIGECEIDRRAVG